MYWHVYKCHVYLSLQSVYSLSVSALKSARDACLVQLKLLNNSWPHEAPALASHDHISLALVLSILAPDIPASILPTG